MSASGAPKVFISYRREETAGHAGRLYDVMSSRFGQANVFMDVDMAPGVDFVERIKDAVGGCHVLLVIIGPRWSTITNGSIAPRLADPGDFVRLEVEEGLRCADVNVIPVLVGGARMPGASELPKELHPLSRRNALELSDSRWRYDVDRLLGALDRLLAGTSAVTPRPGAIPAVRRPPPVPAPVTPRPAERPAPSGFALALSTTLVAASTALVARAVIGGLRHASEPYDKIGPRGHRTTDWVHVTTQHRIAHILDPMIWGGFTWAVVAAAVAVWLTVRLGARESVVGRGLAGALIGALAGAAGSAVFAVPPNILTSGMESGSRRELLLVIGIALTGGIIGAWVGWLWRRRGSVGLITGLVIGALWELAVIHTGWSGSNDRILKAVLSAALFVGATAFIQAALDASERRAA